MSDRMRHRSGERNCVVAAVDSPTVIEIGDLLWQDANSAKPASTVPAEYSGVNVDQQAAFAEKFLGVAMQRSRSGDIDPVQVATTGVFEFGCPSEMFELGDLIGVALYNYPSPGPRDYSSQIVIRSRLENQRVAKITDPKYAIGRVQRLEHSPITSVLTDIRSTVMGNF